MQRNINGKNKQRIERDMYIKVDDLKKGDEILFPAGSNIVHAILLNDPVKTGGAGNWYKRTKCSICATIKQNSGNRYDWKTKTTKTYTSNRTIYGTDVINGERINKSMDLQNYKMIWLLNRENV